MYHSKGNQFYNQIAGALAKSVVNYTTEGRTVIQEKEMIIVNNE